MKEFVQTALPDIIEQKIHVIRGEKVMLSSDLAVLYDVEVRALNQAVQRNLSRFPEDFMFQLTKDEFASQKSQFVISGRKGVRRLPYAFTEHGVAMLSSVLKSERAIAVNIEIVRAFVRLRRLLQTHEELRQKLEALEHRYDGQFAAVFQAIKQMMEPTKKERRRI